MKWLVQSSLIIADRIILPGPGSFSWKLLILTLALLQLLFAQGQNLSFQ